MSTSLLDATHGIAVVVSEVEYAEAACAATNAHVPDDGDAIAVCVRCGLPWPCPEYLCHRDALNCLYDPAGK
ncbi:hypothetical protein [Cryptosporangium sp. NPDC048952]|uniref:hypothetical protein n=1 Tax=Cryptosporangium sp. NPDC048952 TaxID=3363961 RepID=UPI0037173D9C